MNEPPLLNSNSFCTRSSCIGDSNSPWLWSVFLSEIHEGSVGSGHIGEHVREYLTKARNIARYLNSYSIQFVCVST